MRLMRKERWCVIYVCKVFINLPVFNNVLNWSGKSCFCELVIFVCAQYGFFESNISRSMTMSVVQYRDDIFAHIA